MECEVVDIGRNPVAVLGSVLRILLYHVRKEYLTFLLIGLIYFDLEVIFGEL